MVGYQICKLVFELKRKEILEKRISVQLSYVVTNVTTYYVVAAELARIYAIGKILVDIGQSLASIFKCI